MTSFVKLNNPDFLQGSSNVVTGSSNSEIHGGTAGGDTITSDGGHDLVYGDTAISNPNVPLEYTVDLSGLPFTGTNASYVINGGAQVGTVPVSSNGDAVIEIDPTLVNGNKLEVEFTGVMGEINYEFYDLVPDDMSARNIPTTNADFKGVVDDFNVRDLATDLTGSHSTYSVRYTSQISVTEAGEYEFETRSDDGSILFINGEEVVVNDGLHGTQTRSGSTKLEAGTHEVEIVYFENYGADNLSVSVSGPETNGQTIDLLESGLIGQRQTVSRVITPSDIVMTGILPGMKYEFFDSVPSNFTIANIPQENPDYSGVTDSLDVGGLAESLTGDKDTFSIRYTGAIYIDEEGQYDFSSLSDDGFSLRIGGETIIEFDGLHAPKARDGSAILEAGLHDVEILYFENRGQNVLDLTMAGPDTDGEVIDLFDSSNLGHRGEVFTTEGGDDLIIAGEGDDTIIAGAGDDAIIGGEGADDIDGGAGTDVVGFEESAEAVVVNLETGTGSGGDAEGDTYVNVENVHGSTHDDTIIGDENRNRLSGHNGDDDITGGDGNDVLIGGAGADLLDGGEGDRDAVEYSWSTEGVVINLETGVGTGNHADGDVIVNTEYVYGSFYDDEITGDDGVNRLVGRHGDDMLNGGAGNDILVGGEGADKLIGGAGDRDAADYGDALAGVALDLALGGFSGEAEGDKYDGIEFVYGSDFDDKIIGDAGNNRLVGGAGDDKLAGGDGNDYLIGGKGADFFDGGAGTRDTVEYRDATAGVGVDLANGGFSGEADGDTFANVEYVYGSNHDDAILGDDAQNRLIGFQGDDKIFGGAGNDYIIGMLGNDKLAGGAGDDVFLYKTNFGDDVITDFEAGAGRTDRIWLDLDGVEDVSDLNITDTTQGALIDAGGYGTILLENLFMAELNSDDFIF